MIHNLVYILGKYDSLDGRGEVDEDDIERIQTIMRALGIFTTTS